MSLSLTFDELLKYTSEERDRWRGWLIAHANALHASVHPHDGGRFATVGKLVDHIFLVERRHVQWLSGEPVSESTGLSANNVEPLFDYGASVRRELEQFATLVDESDDGDIVRTLTFRGEQWTLTPRKALFNILLHEIRHWAQVALAVRRAGFSPPGAHDLIDSRALR
jgi:uncharacterized damage-inducible protein DinB